MRVIGIRARNALTAFLLLSSWGRSDDTFEPWEKQFAIVSALSETSMGEDQRVHLLEPGALVWISETQQDASMISTERMYFSEPGPSNDDLVLCIVASKALISIDRAVDVLSKEITKSRNNYSLFLGRGNAFAASDKLEEAIADFDRAIAIKPGHFVAWLRRADALRRLGKLGEAIADCSHAIELEPMSSSAYLGRARVLSDGERYSAAILDCTKALTLNPQGAGAHLCRAFQSIAKGDLHKAIPDVVAASKLGSGLGYGAQFVLNQVLEKDGAFVISPEDTSFPREWKAETRPQALLSFSKSVPGLREHMVAIGLVGEYLGDNRTAFMRLDTAAVLQLPPQVELLVLFHRARSLLALNLTDDSLHNIMSAINFATKNPTATTETLTLSMLQAEEALIKGFIHQKRIDSSEIHERNGLDKPLASYDEAIRMNPNLARAYYQRGFIFLNRNEIEKALTEFETVLSLPNISAHTRMLRYYGRSYVRFLQNQNEEALHDLAKVIELQPNDLLLLLDLRCRVYLNLKKYEESISDCDTIITHEPGSIIAYQTRAAARCQLKQLVKAIEDYNVLLGLDPKNADTLCERAEIRRRSNEFAEALADFEKAIQIEPKNLLAAIRIGWIRSTCPDATFRDAEIAITNSKRACEMSDWKAAVAIEALAAAYAEGANFVEARSLLSRAIALDPKQSVERRQRMKELFEQGEPYRHVVDEATK